METVASDLSSLLSLYDAHEREIAELRAANAELEDAAVARLQFQVELSTAYKEAVAEADSLREQVDSLRAAVARGSSRSPQQRQQGQQGQQQQQGQQGQEQERVPGAMWAQEMASVAERVQGGETCDEQLLEEANALRAELVRTQKERDAVSAELARTSSELHALRNWVEDYQYGSAADSGAAAGSGADAGVDAADAESRRVSAASAERIELLLKEKHGLEDTVAQLEMQLARAATENAALSEAVVVARGDISLLEARDTNRSVELERAAAEIVQVDAEYGAHFQDMELANGRLQARIEALEADKARLQGHIDELNSHMQVMRQAGAPSFTAAGAPASELEALVAHLQASEAREKKRVRQLRAKLKTYVARVAAAEKPGAAPDAAPDAVNLSDANVELALLSDEMDAHTLDATLQLQAALSAKDAAERAAAKAEARARTAEAVATSKEDGKDRAMARLREANTELQSRVALLLAQIAELDAMNEDLSARLAAAEAREGAAAGAAREMASQGQAGASALTKAYQDAVADRDAANAALAAARNEIDQLHTRLASAAQLKAALKSTLLVQLRKRTDAFKTLRTQYTLLARRLGQSPRTS